VAGGVATGVAGSFIGGGGQLIGVAGSATGGSGAFPGTGGFVSSFGGAFAAAGFGNSTAGTSSIGAGGTGGHAGQPSGFGGSVAHGGQSSGFGGAAGHAGQSSSGGGGAGGGSSATWTQIYTQFLSNAQYASNCNGSACHNPGKQKGIDFSSKASGYASVKNNTSQFVSVLSSGSMPAGKTKMPAADLAVIKAWVAAGALDN
jgi:hypothetical protein